MKKQKKPNKKYILNRLILPPPNGKREFFAREMKMLNILEERYSLEFLQIVSFEKKFDSLAYLMSDKLKYTMDQKFRAFNYKPDLSRYEQFKLEEKCGEDYNIPNRKKTIKDFLT